MPVIVGGNEHAFVLVGYERVRPGEPDERITFFRHDDETGPYIAVENFRFDDYAPWEYLVVPLPVKVYVAGEAAEVVGEAYLRQALEDHPSEGGGTLLAGMSDPKRPYSFRATVLLSNEFKAGLDERGVPPVLAAVYRRMQMSRWVWVIELVDRVRRNQSEPYVLAEVVLDATDHVRDRRVLAYRVPGVVAQWDPDADRIARREIDPVAPLRPASFGITG